MSLEHSMADGGQAPLLPPLMGKGLRASVPGSWLGASAAPEAGGGEHPHSFPPRFHCPLPEGLCSRAGTRTGRPPLASQVTGGAAARATALP